MRKCSASHHRLSHPPQRNGKSLAHFFFSYDECLHIYLVCEQNSRHCFFFCFGGWVAVQRHHGFSSSYSFLYARKEHFFSVNMERMRRWTFKKYKKKKFFFFSLAACTYRARRMKFVKWRRRMRKCVRMVWYSSFFFVKSIVQYRSSDNPLRRFWRDRKEKFSFFSWGQLNFFWEVYFEDFVEVNASFKKDRWGSLVLGFEVNTEFLGIS